VTLGNFLAVGALVVALGNVAVDRLRARRQGDQGDRSVAVEERQVRVSEEDLGFRTLQAALADTRSQLAQIKDERAIDRAELAELRDEVRGLKREVAECQHDRNRLEAERDDYRRQRDMLLVEWARQHEEDGRSSGSPAAPSDPGEPSA
jgi:septal ring factor EnvC (AmiA/AmiB activator)